jgi:hypothetical protein
MYRVDIRADLNNEDQTGYVRAILDEARDPARITPGALVVAGDQDTAAVCQVVDLAPGGDGTIVHLRLLPGLVDDYRAALRLQAVRARAAEIIAPLDNAGMDFSRSADSFRFGGGRDLSSPADDARG